MSIFAEQVTAHGLQHAYLRYVPPEPSVDPEAVVFVHGIAGSSGTWLPAMAELARLGFERPVVSPDCLGHGDSSKPRTGDYSLAAHATAIRDLIIHLGFERVTLVGHSLGGGVCLQFAYQYPELAGRLVLVSSGGLGRDVSPAIRAALLPGASAALAIALNRRIGAALL
ncbi:MAG: alpha/beta fold hydrolase, partial [Thermocrispum sp.]